MVTAEFNPRNYQKPADHCSGDGTWCRLTPRAVNVPSRSFTVPGEGLYKNFPTSTFTKNLFRHYAKQTSKQVDEKLKQKIITDRWFGQHRFLQPSHQRRVQVLSTRRRPLILKAILWSPSAFDKDEEKTLAGNCETLELYECSLTALRRKGDS